VDVFGEQFDPVEELMSSEHLVETCGKIKNLYRGVCEYLTTMHSRRHSVLRERMISYIHQHFLDESLTQTRMAEDLGITAPYLSSLFKQATGTSMVDYIGRLRVDQAKLLLAEGSQTLSEIAAAVGCGTDKTLIRLFKRFEGVTPGRFRETRLPGPRLEREA
jgi:two-component system, response regulator YesN